jgi:hypothetical protein
LNLKFGSGMAVPFPRGATPHSWFEWLPAGRAKRFIRKLR